MSFQPTQIFEEGTTEEKGENARLAAFVGAIAVGDLVKSTLGPKGMDKILQSASTAEIMVTNDGATILKSIALDNAAAKVLVNISKVQDDEVGDGTTSVAVLAAELLREAEKLVDKKIHPQTIIEGYRIASQAALKALEESAVDHSKSPEAFRHDLLAIARTTLSSKVLAQDRDQFAQLAVDAVLRLKTTDLNHIQIIKKSGGKLSDSYLDEGFILDKKIGVNQPKRLEKAKILVANTSMDTDKVKIFGARVKVGSTSKLAELEKAEKEKMKAKVEKIKAHGINCFINRQLIYNWPEQLFTDAGIMSIEHADFDGIERLALVTGGEIASTFDHPDQVKLGHCDVIEEVIIGEDTLIKFSGVSAGEACTIVLRGATEQLLDEAERSLHDALAVLSQTVKEPRTTLGGGCAEMLMAKAVEGAATRVEGKRQLAVSSFAVALRQLPTILADNAGLDSGDLVARLRKALYDGLTTYGLDLMTPGGGIADMRDLGVIESYKLKKAVVSSASEAAELLLRVDDIIRAAPRRREPVAQGTRPNREQRFRYPSDRPSSSLSSESEDIATMGQLKITDMFSSPLKRPSSQRSTTHHSQPATPSRASAHAPQSKPAEASLPAGLPRDGDSHAGQTASFPSAPSTPISKASSLASGTRRAGRADDHALKTRPQAQSLPALSTASQCTPSRATQLAQASSPHTPFGISSTSETSESDFCEIQHVQPSPNPKRKLSEADRQVRPSKKVKTEQTPRQGTSASVNKKTTSRKSSRVPSQLEPPSSSSGAPGCSNLVPEQAALAFKPKFLPQADNNSDCFIEKVLSSPKRRQQTQQQPAKVKRRRINGSSDASAFVREGQEDSECEITNIKPSPNRLSLTMLTSTDSDADDERPDDAGARITRKIATPRKRRALPLKPVDNHPAMGKPAATPSSAPSQVAQSPVIDLSQLVTSDSDSSAVDGSYATTQATQPLPAQGEPVVRSDQPEQRGPTNLDTTRELAPSPEEKFQSQNQPDSGSEDITGKLMDFLDSQLEAMKARASSNSSDNEPSPTAPEHHPAHEELVQTKVEAQEDPHHIKKEIDSGTGSSGDDGDGSQDPSSHEAPGRGAGDALPAHEHAHSDQGSRVGPGPSLTLVKTERDSDSDSDSSSHVSYQTDTDFSELLKSSPPASYQLPPTEEDCPKPIKTEPDTEAEDESDTEHLGDEPLHTSVSNFNERLAAATPSYKLQPVYSGDKLSETNEPGTPGSFQPHHRDSLIGLKSILKRPKTSPAHASGDETECSPSLGVSPLSRSKRASSSPSERVQGSKKPAKAPRPSQLKKQIPSAPFLRLRSWLPPWPDLPKRAKAPLPKRPRGWRLQKKQLTPLVPLPPASLERDSDDSTSSQETPSKPPTKRPSDTVQQPTEAVTSHKTSEVGASEDVQKKTSEKQKPRPIINSNWVKPPREIKPAVVRDGVSEHAIKPTVARFEKKMAAGKGFSHTKADSPNRKYNWDVDWSMPPAQTERTTRALAAELEERGIKTDRQYANFWYNITMKYSQLAGSHVPLFTAKKKALDDIVEEALQNEERRKKKERQKAKKQKKQQEKQQEKQQQEEKKQPEGVEAILLWRADETDEESKSDDSSTDMEALVAKMRADTEKQRKLSGVGTSCGRRKK
ncbi:hypothetical protein ACHAPT_009217 [Fusarium lateritium]